MPIILGAVAHPFLHSADVGMRDHARPEGVAQVVKAQRSQASAV
jgi:hypothetical protein